MKNATSVTNHQKVSRSPRVHTKFNTRRHCAGSGTRGAPENAMTLSAADRQNAVDALVKCLKGEPSNKEWGKALDRVLRRHWPCLLSMPLDEKAATFMELSAIVEEARAKFRAPQFTTHQRAVHALLDLALSDSDFRASFPDAELSVPYDQIPALFRRAIGEHATHGEERYGEEVAILEHALTLLEQGGDETTRTPEQEEFYQSLAWWKENYGKKDGLIRVKYEPQNVTVN